MRALAFLLLLTPLCVGWNGSGPAVTDISHGRHSTPDQFRSEAVCAGHSDRVEIIVVVPVLDSGDGVLSLRFDSDIINRDVDLPSVRVRARYREYGEDGSTRFAGATVSSGFARLAGDPRGALTLSLDAVFIDRGQTRHVVTDARLVALDWEPSVSRSGGTDLDEPDGYYEGGCSGNYYESDYEDEGYNESYDDDGGCGGDDLGDEPPADDSGGGCAGDDDDYSSDSDASGDTGCGGDDYDSDDDYDDDDDSGSGCAGDDVEDAIVGFVRSGGNGPWLGRMVRWLPWMCVFFAIRLMRRRRPRALRVS